MKGNLQTIGVVIALILFGGIATVGIPWAQSQFSGGPQTSLIEESELITIDLEVYLLGEVLIVTPGLKELDGLEVHPMALAGILTAITIGALLAVGVPLGIIYSRLDDTTTAVKDDEDFKTAVAELDKQHTAEKKAWAKSSPPDGIPSHQLPRWSMASNIMIGVFFMLTVGVVVAQTFTSYEVIGLFTAEGRAAWPTIGVFSAIALVGMLLFLRPNQLLTIDESDFAAVPWGTIWVIVSGLIFLGVGMGLMVAVRAAG